MHRAESDVADRVGCCNSLRQKAKPGAKRRQELEYQDFVSKALRRLNERHTSSKDLEYLQPVKEAALLSDEMDNNCVKRKKMNNVVRQGEDQLEADPMISKGELIRQNQLLAAENTSLRSKVRDFDLLLTSLDGLKSELQIIKVTLNGLMCKQTMRKSQEMEFHCNLHKTGSGCRAFASGGKHLISSNKVNGLTTFNREKPQVARRTQLHKLEPHLNPEALFKFGDKQLTGRQLQRCKHSGKVSRLTLDLFRVLFTPREMALGNLSGKTTTYSNNLMKREKLHEGRISGIIDYVTSVFEGKVDRLTIEDEVKRAIANKVNNFSKSEMAKLVRAVEWGNKNPVSASEGFGRVLHGS